MVWDARWSGEVKGGQIKFHSLSNTKPIQQSFANHIAFAVEDDIQFSHFKWIWVDFNQPTVEESAHLADTFHFHPQQLRTVT